MYLIFIGAHPDDETFASGTIAKYVDHGHKATIVMATRGERGHWKMPPDELERVRIEEMKKAAKVLGAEVIFLDYKDAYVPSGDNLKEGLVDIVRKLKPDIVITFHPLVWRDDHRRVGLATVDACFKACLPFVETEHPAHRPVPDIYLIGCPMVPMKPDICIDVTDYMDVKMESLRHHESQWVQWEIDEDDSTIPLEKILDRFQHIARQCGLESGVKYAEAFISRQKTALDFFPRRLSSST